MDEKISVIIPVYNGEKTIIAAVNSVINQTYKNLEIIVVDDGSSDKTAELLSDAAERDSRITVLSKQNGGQGSARNMGIDSAGGEYIAFIDGDDTIEPEFISTLYKNAAENAAELSICGIRLIKNGVAPPPPEEVTVVLSRHEAITSMLAERYLLFSVCDKLYKRSLFGDIRFEEGVIHEDILFPYQLVKKCSRAVYTSAPLYNYRLNSQSTTGSAFSPKRLYDITAREKVISDIAVLYPDLNENAVNIRLVGYLNMINSLINDKTEYKAQYLPTLIKDVRQSRNVYLKNKFISRKKKLGVILISIGAPAYKIVYNLIKG